MITLVVAMDEAGLIGKNNRLPWHCPSDLAHFKRLTWHQHILMGKATFCSLPKPLEERYLHVASHTLPKSSVYMLCVDVEALCKEWKEREECLFVCGGAHIYAQCIPYADAYWISYIHGQHDGDTWFPAFSLQDFVLLEKREEPGCTIVHYRREERMDTYAFCRRD